MTKENFEKIISATNMNISCERSVSGYYRLLCDNEVIYDDSACEELNGTEEEAMDFFSCLILENYVPEDKKEMRCGMWFLIN